MDKTLYMQGLIGYDKKNGPVVWQNNDHIATILGGQGRSVIQKNMTRSTIER